MLTDLDYPEAGEPFALKHVSETIWHLTILLAVAVFHTLAGLVNDKSRKLPKQGSV